MCEHADALPRRGRARVRCCIETRPQCEFHRDSNNAHAKLTRSARQLDRGIAERPVDTHRPSRRSGMRDCGVEAIGGRRRGGSGSSPRCGDQALDRIGRRRTKARPRYARAWFSRGWHSSTSLSFDDRFVRLIVTELRSQLVHRVSPAARLLLHEPAQRRDFGGRRDCVRRL
jgi:hypothetical protein